jgi:hypothetical protein
MGPTVPVVCGTTQRLRLHPAYRRGSGYTQTDSIGSGRLRPSGDMDTMFEHRDYQLIDVILALALLAIVVLSLAGWLPNF